MWKHVLSLCGHYLADPSNSPSKPTIGDVMYWRLEQIRLAEVLAKTLLCVDPADPIVLLWRPASIWQQLKGHFPLDSRQLQMSTVLLPESCKSARSWGMAVGWRLNG